MHPVQCTIHFNTQSASISLLAAGNILLKVSPVINTLPPEQSIALINIVLDDFYAVRNAPNRPEFRYVEIGNNQQAVWRTNLFGPFHLLSPDNHPREVIVPVITVSLAAEE